MTTNVLPDLTRMAGVALDVADLDAQTRFYRDVLLLEVTASDVDRVTLGRGGADLVTLRHRPDLPKGVRRSAGLFHTALLHPDASALAAVLASVALRTPQLYTGSGDHLVSQAFYLDDPEGNGVELYVDRPRDTWVWRHGRVAMTTEYIDPMAFITDHLTDEARDVIESAPDTRAPLGALQRRVVGHVHLKVGRTELARDFYVDALGFETTAELPGALFVSAGGYHHHMAMNTWGTEGVGLRAPALGLGRVAIEVPDADAVAAAADRLRTKGHVVRSAPASEVEGAQGTAIEVDDPWGNLVRVEAVVAA